MDITQNGSAPAGPIVDINRVLDSLKRQMGELHQELAVREALIEVAQGEIANLRSQLDMLAAALPVEQPTEEATDA